jgi:hypothetical protein
MQLQQSEQQSATLRQQLHSLSSREQKERGNRQQLAKAKLELLNMRNAAESDLNQALAGTLALCKGEQWPWEGLS